MRKVQWDACVCVRVFACARARGYVHVCEHVAFHKDDLRFLKGERSSVVGLIQRDLPITFICLILPLPKQATHTCLISLQGK